MTQEHQQNRETSAPVPALGEDLGPDEGPDTEPFSAAAERRVAELVAARRAQPDL